MNFKSSNITAKIIIILMALVQIINLNCMAPRPGMPAGMPAAAPARPMQPMQQARPAMPGVPAAAPIRPAVPGVALNPAQIQAQQAALAAQRLAQQEELLHEEELAYTDITKMPEVQEGNEEEEIQEFLNAANKGEADTIIELLKLGVHPDVQDDEGNTALSRAAAAGQNSIIRILLDNHADPNVKNDKGFTAIDLAIFNRRPDTVSLLTQFPDVNLNSVDNENNRSPLHYAALLKNPGIAKILLSGGADLSLKDSDGETALDIAKRLKDENFIKVINQFEELKNKLFKAVFDGNYNQVDKLAKKISLKIFNSDGDTPLHLAVRLLDAAVTRFIVNNDRSTIKLPNKSGELAIDLAKDEQSDIKDIINTLKGS